MKPIQILLAFFLLVSALSCNNNPVVESQEPLTCDNLKLIDILSDSFIKGEKLTALVENNCTNCYQSVYTGLMFFGGKDTLAIDTAYNGEWSPDNNSIRQYRLRALRTFDFKEITRVQMSGICDSLIWDL